MKPKNKELKQRIIRTTSALIIQNGVENTSTVKVARRLNIAQSNIYSYFPNKQALLLDVFRYHQAILITRLAPVLHVGLAPKAQIDALTQNMIQFGQEDPETIQIIRIFRQTPSMRPLLPKISDDPFFTALFQQLAQFQQRGLIIEIDLPFLVENVFSIIINYLTALEAGELDERETTTAHVCALVDCLVLTPLQG